MTRRLNLGCRQGRGDPPAFRHRTTPRYHGISFRGWVWLVLMPLCAAIWAGVWFFCFGGR